MMSLLIAAKGYKVVYEPEAVSYEDPSISIREEFKRKVRIAAGGFQAMMRLRKLTNIRKFGLLSFQYISHRMLRWAVVPPLLVLIFVLNIILALKLDGFYTWLAVLQGLFYLFALFGWILELRNKKFKLFTIPLFFAMMNVAVFFGFYRFITGKQKVTWEKATRLT
jgi:cellulose synthase/poly-beta-1,6-N-acetylglucosamine synthase-like glycosyltransferase